MTPATGSDGIDRRSAAVALVMRLCVLGTVASPISGCVRRTMTITTDPPHAQVFLNDHEIGVSDVQTDFTWYGDYDVVIRKDGYETLHTHWRIDAPWYQWIPVDFFTEVLWPGECHDQRSRHFELAPVSPTDTDALVARAREIRKRALDPRK